MKDEDTIRSALTWFGDQGGNFDPLDAFNKVTESYAKLLAACKLALPEVASLHYVAGCVDDAISPEWRRLQGVKDALNEAIKLAEGDS